MLLTSKTKSLNKFIGIMNLMKIYKNVIQKVESPKKVI